MSNKEKFVRFLLSSEALTFGDFILKSGRRSPYMINTGKFDTGRMLARLGSFYAYAIYEKMELETIPRDTNILFGSAYKGIPIASAASIAMAAAFDVSIGYSFNRKETKDHGEGGVFIGKKPGRGDRVLIVDDVMTAGTALRDTVDLLRAHAPEAKVVGCVIAVDRMEHGRDSRLSAVAEAQYELGIPIFSIIDIYQIVAALKQGTFTAGMLSQDKADLESERIILQNVCEQPCESGDPVPPPTPEQIAAIEAYLEYIRPS